MNPEAQLRLNEILKKDPSTLTDEEIAFLRARRSYLKQIQLDEYKDVLTDKHQTSEKSEAVKETNDRPTK